MNGNNTTVKWIAIIVTIFLLIAAWAYATVSGNVERIHKLETGYEVILEKLKTIESDIKDIKMLVD